MISRGLVNVNRLLHQKVVFHLHSSCYVEPVQFLCDKSILTRPNDFPSSFQECPHCWPFIHVVKCIKVQSLGLYTPFNRVRALSSCHLSESKPYKDDCLRLDDKVANHLLTISQPFTSEEKVYHR